MLAHEQKAALQGMRRRDASRFAAMLRGDARQALIASLRTCETEEQRRDVNRLIDLLNDIAEKHERKSEKF